MKRILFCSVSIGAGHDLAAKAVIQEIGLRYPECQTKLVDTFKYINTTLNKVIVGSYMESLKFSPKIWGYLYDQAESGDKLVDISGIMSNLLSSKMEKLINEFDPQVVVCTHAFPAGIISALKGKGKLNVPLIAVMTDYTVHPYWIHDYIDTYVLPGNELKYEIIDMGVLSHKIMATGIPLRSQFVNQPDRDEMRVKLNLQDKITVLVMGGGLGLGQIEDIIRTLGDADLDIQIICVAGKNYRLLTKLQLITVKNQLRIFGYIENMAEVMSASDFIVTKPGGLTTAEVMSQGIPMIIVDPLPGQELRNTEFLLNAGVAIRVRNTKHLVPQLKNLLNNEFRIRLIKEMTAGLGKPFAAMELVDYMECIIGQGEF